MRLEVATLDDGRLIRDAILDATSLRGFLNAVIAYADAAAPSSMQSSARARERQLVVGC
jgi:hypothetical protein